jgi:acetyl esterase/lipase/lysophospholipase L1-like esterase
MERFVVTTGAAFMKHAQQHFARVGVFFLLSVFTLATSSAHSEVRIERGVAYAEVDGEKLLVDIYRPAEQKSGEKYPAVILIHGGGWQGGDRTAMSMAALGQSLAEAGFVAFSVDYRLVKQGGKGWVNQYPVPIEDCRRAVRWVREHAADYGVDAAKIGAAGDSAGGHLVALLGTTDVAGKPSSRVQAVVDIYGPADLTGDYSKLTIGEIKVQDLVDAFVPTTEAKRASSPLLHIDDESAAFLIFHGDADPIVGVAQSRDFHAALQKAGRQSEYVEFPGAGHGFAGKDWDALVAKSIAFFNKELKGIETPVAKVSEGATKPAEVDWGGIFQLHYANRVRAFQEQNAVFQNVVMLGDSITEGFDVTKLLPGRRVLNRGIGGDVIGNALPADDKRGVLGRMDESVFNCSATDVFLLIGINDLGSGRTPDVMEPGYRQILERIKQETPRMRVHVQSVLPCRGNHAKHNANVLDFNERLKKLAAEFGYDYVDLHKLMVDDKGELKAEYTPDGLHLNAAGYAPWKAEVERVMGW